MEKNRESVLRRFFWPGVIKDIQDYCKSFPECQKHAAKPQYRNPLIPLPIIETPFKRIGKDLVGPFVKSAKGFQYILVIVDYITRYPESNDL